MTKTIHYREKINVNDLKERMLEIEQEDNRDIEHMWHKVITSDPEWVVMVAFAYELESESWVRTTYNFRSNIIPQNYSKG